MVVVWLIVSWIDMKCFVVFSERWDETAVHEFSELLFVDVFKWLALTMHALSMLAYSLPPIRSKDHHAQLFIVVNGEVFRPFHFVDCADEVV